MVHNFIEPLKATKRLFSYGEYIATIVTAGFVSEMLAILLWKINPLKLNNEIMDKRAEKKMFGIEFEKMKQAQRIEKPILFKMIDDDLKEWLNYLKDRRNHYLHKWRTGAVKEKRDALNVLKRVFLLFKAVMGSGVKEGKMLVNPKVKAYLEQELHRK